MVSLRKGAALLLSGILVGLLGLLAAGRIGAGLFWGGVLVIALITALLFPKGTPRLKH